LRDVRIGVYVQKFVGLQTPEDAIEEVPAAGVAMTRDSGGGVEKIAGGRGRMFAASG
jgi:hypothetical protein